MSRRKAKPARRSRIPRGAIAADVSQQVHGDSNVAPPPYYVDITFKCRDCGGSETWTAKQQKWYYEVAKASEFARPVRCRDCRNQKRQVQPPADDSTGQEG